MQQDPAILIFCGLALGLISFLFRVLWAQLSRGIREDTSGEVKTASVSNDLVDVPPPPYAEMMLAGTRLIEALEGERNGIARGEINSAEAYRSMRELVDAAAAEYMQAAQSCRASAVRIRFEGHQKQPSRWHLPHFHLSR
jgi:hypothetical protein